MEWLIIILILIVLYVIIRNSNQSNSKKKPTQVISKEREIQLPRKTDIKWRFEQIHDFLNAKNVVFLDTETSGKTDKDQIVEITILDLEGNVLLDTLVQPTVKVSHDAHNAHQISNKDLKKAPAWPDVYKRFLECTQDSVILAYNSKFDKRMVQQSCKAHGIVNKRRKWGCIMLAYSTFQGSARNERYKWYKLVEASYNASLDLNHLNSRPHRAHYDTAAALGVFLYMKKTVNSFLKKQLGALKK